MAKKQFSRIPVLLLLAALILAAILPLSAHAATTRPLQLSEKHESSLAGYMEILIDKGGTLSINEILLPEFSSRFTALPGFVNQSYTADVVWVRFSLIRTHNYPEDSYLRLWPPYLDFVTVYVQTSDTPLHQDNFHSFSFGDHLPATERPVIHSDFLVPLELPENKPRWIYLRVKTSSTLNLAASIHTNADLITHSNLHLSLQGGYLAICLVIGMINLILFLRLKDRLYLYFSLYVFFLFINNAASAGVITLIWPSHAHLISDYMVGSGAGCILIFFSLFGMQLFSTSGKPFIHRFFIVMIVMGAVTAASVPFGLYNKFAPFMFISLLSIIFILTWLSYRYLKRGEQGGSLYLTAFGISNLAYAVQFLRVLGILPVAWWNMNAVQVGSIFNMIFMTLALTERLHAAEKMALNSALKSEQSAVELANVMTVDLRTKQHELERALATEHVALERQSRFVEMVSHEYRTPLAIIRANLDILELREKSQGQKTSGNIAKMQRAVARLVEVIETSLMRSRLHSSEFHHKQEIVSAQEFLDEINEEASGLWPNVALNMNISHQKAVFFLADPSLLKTALFNLIDNAVKYSTSNDPITLSLEIFEQEVRMAVADLGQGIPAHERLTVCEKYHRGGSSVGKAGGGLGLFLVTKILEEHGGRLELSPNRPQGTVATIIIPRVADSPGSSRHQD